MDVMIYGATEDDPSVAMVAAALRRRGVEPWVLDARGFPGEMRISFTADGAASGSIDGRDLGTVGAVWVRHMEAGAALPEEMDPAHRQVCTQQAYAALWSLLDCIDAYVLDPPIPLLGSPRKPGMQRMAVRHGLTVPRSLISNDADAVRRFAVGCPGGLIGKLIESGGVTLQDGAGTTSFPTFEITEDDLATFEGLELSPMLFQEKVTKRREIRLTVVGHRVFAASVEPGDVLDWRTDQDVVRSFRAFDALPAAVERSVLALMDELGLDYGTVDLIQTPDDRWVFLEVNSVSFFDHVERYAGLPIADAIADLLLGVAPSRFPGRRRG